MFKLVNAEMIIPNAFRMTFEAPAVAKSAQPGQFIIVRADEDGERIPLSLSDWDAEKGTVTTVVQNVGNTTGKLAELKVGESIPTLAGPLGTPSEIENFGAVVCLCGCYGIGSVYPIARALKEKGNKVFVVMESRSSFLMYWEEKLRDVADKIVYITRDGTKGIKGHVDQLPEIIDSFGVPVNRIIINGCTLLLKKGCDASRPLGIKTIVALNPIMIDGTGMCGVCRVTVGSETKFACVDGPDFDGHEVDWDELFMRRKSYVSEETKSIKTSGCKKRTCHSQ